MNKYAPTALIKLFAVALVWAVAAVAFLPFNLKSAAQVNLANNNDLTALYKRPAPNFDLNTARGLQGVRQATQTQLAALDALKAAVAAPNADFRWNAFGGSPDAIYGFASAPSSLSPENAARAFLSQNAGLFGISNVGDLRVFSNREALGGHLIRFQQTFNGIDVVNGGIGVVLNKNKQIIMVSGPHFRDINIGTTPTVTAAQAKDFAANDLAQFSQTIPVEAQNMLGGALNLIQQQTAVVNQIQPKLGIYPTADGYKLVWKVAKLSTNPFGLYLISIDAHTGETIARKDFVHFQLPNPVPPAVAPFTADIFPKYPTITDELKNQGIISVCGNAPCGQERVTLRSFNPTNLTTGANGTLTGTHALVNNALPTKQPFAQAARGTWHFRENNPTNFEGRTNELDQFAEPAEHQDEINAFFFVTYLLEYVDYLHVAGDRTTFGSQGSFPDDYPNKTIPLPATVHIPNILLALDVAGGTMPNPQDPEFAQKTLGLDNAFALNVTSLIEGVTATKSPVVVNPTFYGHGFLLNDLALEGTVPYHEGMHAITSPIAGLEGEEGGALNEGQADMWAFTITDNASLGDYVINGHKYRQRFRDRGRNPDSVAYIRSAKSTLKYGDIGTLTGATGFEFEEHRDGEIYMSTMWDIREMMNRVYPQATQFKRPQPKDGAAQKAITKGTEIFERDFLGSMYILGTTAPDTLVKSKDAMIVADQLLNSSDVNDADAPGKNRAMIEQIFAAKELGVRALEVSGGVATISTQVTDFVGNQTAPQTPQNVTVVPASTRTNLVSWNAVPNTVSYQILKRKKGLENQREQNGKRAFNDGDDSTTGFRHVAFVNGNETTFEDKGAVFEVFAPAGLSNLFDSDYVVRAISVNSTGQLGFSQLSGSANTNAVRQDLTANVTTATSNVSFAGGKTTFDAKLTNVRGANAADKTIYSPLEFQIVSVSNPNVTAINNGSFIFNQTLTLGAQSLPKQIEFSNPNSEFFSFDAKIFGNAQGAGTTGNGGQNGDGSSNPLPPVTYSIFTENLSGTLVGGEPTATGGTSLTWGDPMFKGITWDDVLVTTKDDALILDAALSSLTAVDLDFELRTTGGQILATSAGATAAERVISAVQPNTTYVLRVKGFANGPSTFNIESKQLLPNGSANANGGSQSTGGNTTGAVNLVRFSVNPLTGGVTSQILR